VEAQLRRRRQVQKLLANAAKIAAADMRWAIEALLGRDC
jgi:hypothetical protein